MQRFITYILDREPVVASKILTAFIALMTAYGLDLEPEAMAATIVFVELILSVVTRSRTTTPAHVKDYLELASSSTSDNG